MKVIIPLHKDKKTVFVRSGRAPLFGVYLINPDDKSFELIKTVINDHHHHHGDGEGHHGNGHGHGNHHEHDHEHNQEHKKQLQPLSDCDYILTLALGPHMKQALISLDIEPVMLKQSEVKTVEDAINKFLETH
jgi:predicted Fe-Mo cluster-binding NifX family protein